MGNCAKKNKKKWETYRKRKEKERGGEEGVVVMWFPWNLPSRIWDSLLVSLVVWYFGEKKAIVDLFADSCTTIKAVGSPVTHHTRSTTQGDWMKDPLGIMGTETIFVMKYYSYQNVVEEFENMEKLKAGATRKTYTLPYRWQATGAVVYGKYLYYNR